MLLPQQTRHHMHCVMGWGWGVLCCAVHALCAAREQTAAAHSRVALCDSRPQVTSLHGMARAGCLFALAASAAAASAGGHAMATCAAAARELLMVGQLCSPDGCACCCCCSRKSSALQLGGMWCNKHHNLCTSPPSCCALLPVAGMVWPNCKLSVTCHSCRLDESNSSNWQQHLWTVLRHSRTSSRNFTADTVCTLLAASLPGLCVCAACATCCVPSARTQQQRSRSSRMFGGHSSVGMQVRTMTAPPAHVLGCTFWLLVLLLSWVGCISTWPLCGAQFCHCRASKHKVCDVC